MDSARGMKIIEEMAVGRRNMGRGYRTPKKEYDGTGPSGYAGTPGSPTKAELAARAERVVLVPINHIPRALRRARGGKKTRRVQKHQWVTTDVLRQFA